MKIRRISNKEIEFKAESKADSNKLREFVKVVAEASRKSRKIDEIQGES